MSVIQFCNDLSFILESDLDLAMDKTLFVGDFNIHANNCQDTDTINFLDTINGFNLQNLVTFVTPVKQHHLDLILDDPNNPASPQCRTWNVSVRPLLHPLSTNHCKEPPNNRISFIQENQSYRPKSIQTGSRVSPIKPTPGEHIDEAVNFYNDKVKYVLDTHAPEKTKVVKRSHN